MIARLQSLFVTVFRRLRRQLLLWSDRSTTDMHDLSAKMKWKIPSVAFTNVEEVELADRISGNVQRDIRTALAGWPVDKLIALAYRPTCF